jgi:hypothetical protein
VPKFKIPYVNSRFIVPAMFLLGIWLSYQYNREGWDQFFSMQDPARQEHGWDVFKHKIPMILFIMVSAGLSVAAFVKRLSLIPILGLTSCLYLMTELGTTNWFRFFIWLVIGLIVYFTFSRRHSKLNQNAVEIQ